MTLEIRYQVYRGIGKNREEYATGYDSYESYLRAVGSIASERPLSAQEHGLDCDSATVVEQVVNKRGQTFTVASRIMSER